MASRCLCLRYRTATSFQARPAACERADGVDDGDGLVLGPGADVELDGGAVGLVGPQALVGREAGLVADDETVGGGQDVADAAEVLLDGEVARGRGVGAPASACAGGRQKRVSNSAKAAKLAPRKR